MWDYVVPLLAVTTALLFNAAWQLARGQRRRAAAFLLAQTSRPLPQWESENRDLMRIVGGWLR